MLAGRKQQQETLRPTGWVMYNQPFSKSCPACNLLFCTQRFWSEIEAEMDLLKLDTESAAQYLHSHHWFELDSVPLPDRDKDRDVMDSTTDKHSFPL